ncbi:hypothetical protein PTRA_a2155 [Pseudoalteromonas translucida KMM 520]|uniref:Uncharacterized protein n=1 Tax=Pseudoalteromonas translucida KMM 520 TaxID=1315283 RepID=A0A0U2WY74_9GAMM|nr:hypothetical protein [Pseudoalteromonas translucida]ALS33272.1 hypothetical protein PTRA_a2155 [Pseudoalteromonas translucida KMM 520]
MNCNPQHFTRKELADFYERLILLWENGDLLNQRFNIRSSKAYKRLKEQYAFDLIPHGNLDLIKAEFYTFDLNLNIESKNVIHFHNAKNNILKSYFYHIRNVAGHADIKKVKFGKINWYVFEHRFSNQIKLFGLFKAADFWKVHHELISLKGNK